LAILWLFLIALEIACPILECGELGDFSSPETTAAVKFSESNLTDAAFIEKNDDETNVSVEVTVSPEHCGGECLCHVTGILEFNFDFPKVHSKYYPPLMTYNDEPTFAISPPTQPPKIA
jgi:hypothetical protein